MNFVDEAKIFVASGNGGNGCISFRRERNIAYGGPNGGNGGRGGDVIFRATRHLNTLVDFRYRQHFCAENGAHGAGYSRAGKAGLPLVLEVPVGTEIWDAEYNWLIADLISHDADMSVCRGGHGGCGNEAFKTSRNRAPRTALPGQPREEKWVILRLKLLADVGLIGFPNAGKSTLLSTVTHANPKIGAYPFTTLYPELGLLYYEGRELVLADLPGLIEGAHEGRGLGHRFLGHAERCHKLLHCIDATMEDVVQGYGVIRQELEMYGHDLAQRKEYIVLTKADLLSAEEMKEKVRCLQQHTGRPVLSLSAVTRKGLDALVYALFCDAMEKV